MSIIESHRQVSLEITAADGELPVAMGQVNGVSMPVFTSIPKTLGEFFETAASNHADKTFSVYQGEQLSYGDNYKRASALAHVLVNDLGVQPGDRVAIAMRNYPEWMTAFVAIASVGAVVVPMNAWWQADELSYGLAHAGAKLAICDAQRLQLIEQSEAQVTCIQVRGADHKACEQFEQSLAQYQGLAMPAVAVDANQDVVILYTSGSTGYPKGAVSTHSAVLTAVYSFAVYGLGFKKLGLLNDDPDAEVSVLVTIPLFHVTGCNCMFLLSTLQGRKVVLMHKWNVDDALALIEREKITTFQGVPTMSLELLNAPNRDHYDLSSLVDISAGGAARPAEHVRRLSDAFEQAPPSAGYGLTETNAIGCINAGEDYLERPGSCGVATQPIVSCEIRDLDGNTLPVGERGEICLRSAANIRGYWGNPEATAAAITSDGYFRTGDVGYLDDDGFLYIVDRIKEIIIRGGENVSCLEVEAMASELSCVDEVVVFGVPDERLGEVVAMAFVAHADEVECDSGSAQAVLTKHLEQRLAAFKVPSHVFELTTQMPRVASGKIDKRTVRQQCLAQLQLDVTE